MAVYSDRLFLSDPDKYDAAATAVFGSATQDFDGATVGQVERFLSAYFNKQVVFDRMAKEKNVATGFPLWVFYFSFQNKDSQ